MTDENIEESEVIEGSEDVYEVFEILIKTRSDGQSWYDVIDEFISDSSGETEEDGVCTCGLVSMGGMSGTLDQCFAWGTTVGHGLKYIDLAEAIVALDSGEDIGENVEAVVEWAKAEVTFENWDYNLPEEFEPYVSDDFEGEYSEPCYCGAISPGSLCYKHDGLDTNSEKEYSAKNDSEFGNTGLWNYEEDNSETN